MHVHFVCAFWGKLWRKIQNACINHTCALRGKCTKKEKKKKHNACTFVCEFCVPATAVVAVVAASFFIAWFA